MRRTFDLPAGRVRQSPRERFGKVRVCRDHGSRSLDASAAVPKTPLPLSLVLLMAIVRQPVILRS